MQTHHQRQEKEQPRKKRKNLSLDKEDSEHNKADSHNHVGHSENVGTRNCYPNDTFNNDMCIKVPCRDDGSREDYGCSSASGKEDRVIQGGNDDKSTNDVSSSSGGIKGLDEVLPLICEALSRARGYYQRGVWTLQCFL